MSRIVTKPTKWHVRPAKSLISEESDQSLRCPLEESYESKLSIERTAKTLIRLGGCPS